MTDVPPTDLCDETQNLIDSLQAVLTRPNKPPPPYQSFAKSLMDKPPSIVTSTPDEISVSDISLPDPMPSEPNTITSGDELVAHSPIGFELWEALAYDIALAHADINTIASEYNLTLAQLDHLQSNEYFAKMLKTKRDEVSQLGSQAAEVAFTVKMRMLANRATPEFLKRLTSPVTSSKDFYNLFKLTVELARLNPVEQDKTNDPMPSGASVVFNINGVPGLSHLQITPTHDTLTQDSKQDSVVSDVDWQEITTRNNDDDELGEL